jgi:ACS family tartrate transporter-like MFS transporter
MDITSGTDRAATMSISTEVERRAFNKIAWRLVPLLSISYVLNYMDRNNVGFAD